MIDIENIVIDRVGTALRAKYPEITVYSSFHRIPQKFPCVLIYEQNNVAVESTMGSEHIERHSTLTYNVAAYSNENTGKKYKVKDIFQTIDSVLTGLGMHRVSRSQRFTLNEATINAVQGMYQCVAGESPSGNENEIMIYRR